MVALFVILLKKSYKVFFQNSNDVLLLIGEKNEKDINFELLPGSGVNLNRFKSNRISDKYKIKYNFLLMSRMIEEKGIYDFIDAAKIVRIKYQKIKFALLGFIENDHKTGIGINELNKWESDGLIKYLGSTDKVEYYINKAD